ncbi:MAG: HAMP domain protein [Candidatus Methanoperedens nitroreducens]|uniref:HAMP domain protein n=1 Tax=Candidatus Methanoperedens nitratireducens TaxID=1392998 RepID=A0A0P7ZDQ7_9EURY|nr:MAG: HAMP domain protein [Candidatus Methanoperedens sp. BLZ1]
MSSILICIGLTRSIMKPLNEFEIAANRISEGDLTPDMKSISSDEIGLLAGYFIKMTVYTQTYNWKGTGYLFKNGN